MYRKSTAALLCFITALTVFIACFSRAAIPKRISYGANWGPFLKEDRDSVDIMFFGSSLVYCDVVPSIIYESTGRISYVLAGPEQTLSTTYYYIKEMYKTQSPSLVFVEASGLFYPKYTKYPKANIGYMPLSLNRINATFKTTKQDEWLGLLFPLYNYHDRWHEMRLSDFEEYERDSDKGYTYLDTVYDKGTTNEVQPSFSEAVYKENLEYLEKIAELCVSNDTTPVFYAAPSYFHQNEVYVDIMTKDIGGIKNAVFFNFNEYLDKMHIDYSTDFYDDLHFNYSGAVKFSKFLSNFIKGL